MSIRDVLAQELPRAALAILAAKRGGAAGLSGFMQGGQEAQMRQQQLQRQAVQDEEQRAYRAQQMAMQQSQESRYAKADEREAREAEYQRRLEAVTMLSERANAISQNAPDAETGERQAAAEAASLAQMAGVEPDLLMSRVPSMGPKISQRKAEAARAWATGMVARLDTARKTAASSGQTLDDETVSLAWTEVPEAVKELATSHGHAAGEPLKLSQIEALAGLPSFRTNATPKTPASIDAAIIAADQRGDEAEVQRLIALKRQVAKADDRPLQGPQPSYVWAVPPGGGQAVRMTEAEANRTGATQPTSGGGGLGAANVQLRNSRTAAALNSVEKLKKLAPVRSPGPLGIIEGQGEVVKGALGYSTKTRQYQALLQPTAMQMAVSIQGAANLSDTERQTMAGMLGSINTMDYESQMALLDSAVDTLKNSADVLRVDGVWVPAGRAIRVAPGAAEALSGERGVVQEWGRDARGHPVRLK